MADLYRERYADRNRPVDRLFVQSFALVDPWWTIRTGAVPYWSPLTSEPDVGFLEEYFERADEFDEIRTALFAHGVESAGLASVGRWRRALVRARDVHGFVGVDENEYPYDVETHVRYHVDLPDAIAARYPHPPPMAIDQFDEVAAERYGEYGLEWVSDTPW